MTSAQSMSRYLVERIEDDPRIDLVTGVEVERLIGEDRLEQVTLKDTANGRRQTLACSSLFCFIGARPATEWLRDCVLLDRKGFVLTGRQLPAAAGAQLPLSYETSLAGVFAAGDVRSGSMKRVAAAVGEGSSAVRSVHERLATGRG